MRRYKPLLLKALLSLAALVLGLSACTNPSTGGNTGNPASFTISLNPTSRTINQGSSGNINLTLTPQNGFTGAVSLSLVKADGTAAPSGITLSPTSVDVSGSSAVTQVLTLSVGSSVQAATHNLKVRAQSGSIVQEASLNLTVSAGPSFTISLNPTSLTLTQGESRTTRLTLTTSGGFSGEVNLSLVDPPAGVSVSPTRITSTSDITIGTNANTPAGQHTLTLRASSGSIERKATLTLTVNQAQAFTVSTTDDTIDAAPGNGTCADSNNNCSLRAAIMEANALRSPTIITLPAGTYTLTRTSSQDEQGDDLDLKSNITLRGAGQGQTILDGNRNFTVIHVHPGVRASLEQLTVRGGSGSGYGAVIGNCAVYSIGEYNNQSTITLSEVSISDNNGYGFCSSYSTTTLTNVTISGNGGSGVYNWGTATATLTNVTISGNGGSGVYNGDTATLTNVTISGNGGSGVYNGGTATLTNATISGNGGSGVYNWGTATLTNVTISGNSTTSSSGGGGIYQRGGTLKVSFSTITNNTAPRGGGIQFVYGTAELRGVILSGNTATATGAPGPECEGSFTSKGYNLIKSNADCSFTLDSTDTLNQDANLAPLADNGGGLLTHLPNLGSPVLDKVPAGNCTTLGNTTLTTDARGVARPQNGSCEIGAVERQ